MTARLIGVRSSLAALAAWCLAVLIASSSAVSTGSVRAAAQDVGTEAQRESGKQLYMKFCAQCHGEKGDGDAKEVHPTPDEVRQAQLDQQHAREVVALAGQALGAP